MFLGSTGCTLFRECEVSCHGIDFFISFATCILQTTTKCREKVNPASILCTKCAFSLIMQTLCSKVFSQNRQATSLAMRERENVKHVSAASGRSSQSRASIALDFLF